MIAAIYASKSTEQTSVSEEKEVIHDTRTASYGRYSSEGQRLAKGTTH